MLRQKHRQAGADSLRLLQWLGAAAEDLRTGKQVALLEKVFGQYYEVQGEQVEPVRVHAGGAIKNPHEPEAHWSAKGKVNDRKEWIGYKVQVAETVAEGKLDSGEPTRNFVCGILTHAAQESD